MMMNVILYGSACQIAMILVWLTVGISPDAVWWEVRPWMNTAVALATLLWTPPAGAGR